MPAAHSPVQRQKRFLRWASTVPSRYGWWWTFPPRSPPPGQKFPPYVPSGTRHRWPTPREIPWKREKIELPAPANRPPSIPILFFPEKRPRHDTPGDKGAARSILCIYYTKSCSIVNLENRKSHLDPARGQASDISLQIWRWQQHCGKDCSSKVWRLLQASGLQQGGIS